MLLELDWLNVDFEKGLNAKNKYVFIGSLRIYKFSISPSSIGKLGN